MNKYKSMGLLNVKKYMKEAGLQSKEVAEKLGVRAETVSRWVSGTNNPGLDQAEQLADILGVTISDILFKQRGMRIAGSVNYDGEVEFYDSMSEISYLPMPGMDTPSHRFCLQVDTHQQEDKHSYNSFSDIHINNKEVSSTCYTMRSLVKIKKGPEELVGKVNTGVLFPAPNAADGKLRFTLQRCKTKEIILDLELEWATPLLSRFYNRNQSEVLDIIDINGHDL
tara:strand:- start:183 stop:857 length:675 start_codon:yes stop_codon:yes gene_type:complete